MRTKKTLAWSSTDSGDLSPKDAYMFKSYYSTQKHWVKSIWSKDIRPSKYLVALRLIHEKLLTDDNLIMSQNLDLVLGSHTGINLHCDSIEDNWKLCKENLTPQGKVAIQASFFKIISTIWLVRNQARFKNKFINWMPIF